MDTKSKKTKLLDFIEKHYKYIIYGIIACICLSVFSYISVSKYKDPYYGYNEDYFYKKSSLESWEWNLYQINFDIYKETNYLSVFKKDQKEINTYGKKNSSDPTEYLIYNKKAKKYLTNSKDVKENMDRYRKDPETIGENIKNDLSSDKFLEVVPSQAPADMRAADGSENPVAHSKFIENADDYIMCFWIPKKEMNPGGYFGVIREEEARIENLKYDYGIAIKAFISLGLLLIVLTRLLTRERRKNASNKMLYKRILNEVKKYIFDYRSIPFKFTFLIGILFIFGVGLCIWRNFYFVDYYVFTGGVIIYLIILLAVIIRMSYFTVKLQRIIDSSDKISSRYLDDKKYNEKNLKRLSEGIVKMREGVKEAMGEQMKSERLKAELVTNISHDLKTPLTSIINYTDILLNKDITEEEKEDYLKVLNSKGLKLKLLIEDLFEISKIASGKEEIKKEKVDLVELINQSIGELSSNIEESNIEFHINFTNRDIILELDGKKMSRVFENLISNIAKYSLSGTRAYIDVLENDEYVNVTFKNISRERINISPDEIFNRFTRGDSSRNSKVEGSGLGLAIAKSIVDLHMGKINVNIDGDLFKVEIILQK